MFGFQQISPRKMGDQNNRLGAVISDNLGKTKKNPFENKMETYSLKMKNLKIYTKKTKETKEGQEIIPMKKDSRRSFKPKLKVMDKL
jgi:predicted DNA-binding protein